MSMRERTGVRDLTYSRWHRPESTARFLGLARAAKLAAIDIDWCEACCFCSEPLALVETQESITGPKSAKITTTLGERARVPVYSSSYVVNTDRTDITGFSFRQLWPESTLREMATPEEYALWLESLRTEHFAQRARLGQCGS